MRMGRMRAGGRFSAAGSFVGERVEDEATLVVRLRILESSLGSLKSTLSQVRFQEVEPAREPFFRGEASEAEPA